MSYQVVLIYDWMRIKLQSTVLIQIVHMQSFQTFIHSFVCVDNVKGVVRALCHYLCVGT